MIDTCENFVAENVATLQVSFQDLENRIKERIRQELQTVDKGIKDAEVKIDQAVQQINSQLIHIKQRSDGMEKRLTELDQTYSSVFERVEKLDEMCCTRLNALEHFNKCLKDVFRNISRDDMQLLNNVSYEVCDVEVQERPNVNMMVYNKNTSKWEKEPAATGQPAATSQ